MNLMTQPDSNNKCVWCESDTYDHIREDGFCSDCDRDSFQGVEEK